MKKHEMPSDEEFQKIKDMAINALDSFTPYALEMHHDLSALEYAVAIAMHRQAKVDNCNPYEYIPDFMADVANYLDQIELKINEKLLP